VSPSDLSAALDDLALVEDARRRISIGASDRSAAAEVLAGGSFLAAAALWLIVDGPTHVPVVAVVACLAAMTVTSMVEFEIGSCSIVPMMPVLVVTLVVVPPVLVPVLAVVAMFLAARLARLSDPGRADRPLVLAASAWYAVGPAAVFAVTGFGGRDAEPTVAFGLALLAAIAAMVIADLAASWVLDCLGLRLPFSALFAPLRFTVAVDVLLVPVGVAAVLALPGVAALALVMPVVVLLSLLQRDRRLHLDRSVALTDALSQASQHARRDALTGLGNRLAWSEVVDEHRGSDAPVGVVLLDVDGLKVANDVFGHAMGDRLIGAVAQVCSAVTRGPRGGIAARIGGDEFGVLVPNASAERVAAVVEALRHGLRATPALDGLVGVHASIGAAHCDAGGSLDEALRQADAALYDDKRRRSALRN
jgi:diguanylate cyclase (GGDEF)-like protein